MVVNGATGEVAGERPWSWIKIALLVLLALAYLWGNHVGIASRRSDLRSWL